ATEDSRLTEAKGDDTRACSSANGSSRRILRVWVVDDNAALRELFARMLTKFSNSYYEVEAFQSGASGCLLKSYGLEEITKLIHEAHRNPGAPGLFPNMASYNGMELGLGQTGARGSSRCFN